MAGDWIKMRAELATHPRLLSIYNELVFGDDPGFLIYVCGSDALDIGVMPPRNDSVTDRALRIITERALRDVTLCSLLRVWCAVNAHCKVEDNDAIMTPMLLVDIDDIAGVSGFGNALFESGWVDVDEERKLLRFANFLEYNEPACLRRQAMTDKERQRRYRGKRNVAKQSSGERVTKVTKRNGREEKRREDNTTPIVPFGDGCVEEKKSDKSEIKSANKSKPKFTRPTLIDVATYCIQRSNGIDPQEFLDHYDACGWRYGSGTGKPIKDWQAAVRTWENRRKTDAPKEAPYV
jgi:hypothetical protein